MVIEKGVPLPPILKSENSRVANKMTKGDSVLCETEDQADNLRHALRRLGRKASQRKTREGWRVWRVA